MRIVMLDDNGVGLRLLAFEYLDTLFRLLITYYPPPIKS